MEGLWFRGYPHKIWPKIWYPGISIDFLSKAAVILGYQMDQQRIGSAKATKRQSKRSGVRMKCTTCFFRHFFPKSPNNTKHMVYDVLLPNMSGFVGSTALSITVFCATFRTFSRAVVREYTWITANKFKLPGGVVNSSKF